MTNHKDTARHFLSLGLNPIPIVQGGKYPTKGFKDFNNRKTTEEDINTFDFASVAVSTGYISKNLEAIDIDLKNAKDGKAFMKEFKSRISSKLLKKLVIQQTPSGGYHLIYRCLTISSSKKIARNPEGEAIIETRGEGGFIVVAPSYGYKLLRGSFDTIPYIDESERFELFIESQKLDQCFLKDAKKRFSKDDLTGFKKFPDYNNDENVAVELLEKHGWRKLERNDAQWISFTRPGTKSGDNHAGYHKEGKFLNVFSTSQSTFEIGRPYNNHAIFAELECDGNYKYAYGKLYDMGHGVELEHITDEEENQQQFKKDIEKVLFLSDEVEERSYLEQASKGLIPQGLTWGWRALDPYTRAKPNSLNMGIGFDNIGKSAYTLSLAMATNILHDWKWGMMMPENRNVINRLRLIETETGKKIKYFGDKSVLLEHLLEKSRDNFKIIANKKHYSLGEVIEMGRKLYEMYGISALLVDPYNFFKVTNSNSHAHNNELLSELRVFAEKYCSVYLIGHPGTLASRKPLDSQGFQQMPTKYDVQGGSDFPYRVDDFFVAHRFTNHPEKEEQRKMMIRVEKVKEKETGGQLHVKDDYSYLSYETRHGFLGYWDENGDNPMYRAKMAKLNISEELVQNKKMKPEDVF